MSDRKVANTSLQLLQGYTSSSDSCDEEDDISPVTGDRSSLHRKDGDANILTNEVCSNGNVAKRDTSKANEEKLSLDAAKNEKFLLTASADQAFLDALKNVEKLDNDSSILHSDRLSRDNENNAAGGIEIKSTPNVSIGTEPTKDSANNSDNVSQLPNTNNYRSVTTEHPKGNNSSECTDNMQNLRKENADFILSCSSSNTDCDDSDDSSEWESLKGVEDCSDSDEDAERSIAGNLTKKLPALKVKGELGIDDLPPIEDLTISVKHEECMLVGTINDIVNQLVIIEALPNKPALDIDTVLFLDEGAKTLGVIFDVFGQVTSPYYCVRFNSNDHIKEKGIVIGMCVYCAPKTEHTHLVFVSELMRLKGSDASWKDDTEPPSQYMEFSDDEEERRSKRSNKDKKRAMSAAATQHGEPSGGRPKQNKPTEYEERMNRKNLQKTAETNRGFAGFRNRHLHVRHSNPFYGRTDNYNQLNSDIRWGTGGNFFMGGNPFEMSPRQRSRFGGALPPLPPLPPLMRPPRFSAPLWFMNTPPPAPPGT